MADKFRDGAKFDAKTKEEKARVVVFGPYLKYVIVVHLMDERFRFIVEDYSIKRQSLV